MTIAIKFCGGCNPSYDRMELVSRLNKDFPNVAFTGIDSQEPSFVVILCGCSSRCATYQSLHSLEVKWVIDSEMDYPALRNAIAKFHSDNLAMGL